MSDGAVTEGPTTRGRATRKPSKAVQIVSTSPAASEEPLSTTQSTHSKLPDIRSMLQPTPGVAVSGPHGTQYDGIFLHDLRRFEDRLSDPMRSVTALRAELLRLQLVLALSGPLTP